jgi:putative transport protein
MEIKAASPLHRSEKFMARLRAPGGAAMIDWFVATLRSYPELAIFLSLAIGFWIGPKKLGGFSLGNVTATLLAAVVIGQLAITISPPVKSVFFLLFLFAVGYGVGPHFFRGLAREGPKQIGFALIVLAFCLVVPYLCARLAGLDLGYAAALAGLPVTKLRCRLKTNTGCCNGRL